MSQDDLRKPPRCVINTCRRRLQNTFEEFDRPSKSGETSTFSNKKVLSVLNLNDNTRQALRNSLAKALNNVRTTFGTITQKFRISTKRRQILEEGPMTPNGATPHTFSKQILGRTPAKLYSPFGIETPHIKSQHQDKGNVQQHPTGA